MSVISDYISQQPSAQQGALNEMYTILHRALPDAQERLSYGMPAFWQGRVLVYFAANAKHIGLYPTAAPIQAFAAQLGEYKTSKGAIQFPYTKPLPQALIIEIAQYRLTHADVVTKPHKRAAVAVPPRIAEALQAAGLEVMFAARPQYQRTDYINWITSAKREATQTKRLAQMLNELAAGDVYMKMPWHGKQQ